MSILGPPFSSRPADGGEHLTAVSSLLTSLEADPWGPHPPIRYVEFGTKDETIDS